MVLDNNDKALQRALHGERRALDQVERTKKHCRSQATLMTKFFAKKLKELEGLARDGSDLVPFWDSVSYILEAPDEIKIADQELRAENVKLMERVEELEQAYVKSGQRLVAPEPSGAEKRLAELERINEKLREELKDAKAKCLEANEKGGRRRDGSDERLRALMEAGDASGALAELKAQHKDAVKKLKKDSEREKEELMTAMEKEVDALIAEERAKFEKALKKKGKAPKNSAALKTLAKRAGELKKEIEKCKNQAKADLKQLPLLAKTANQQICAKVASLENEIGELKRKYQRELDERKRLHNLVQELRGNIRVFCRVRPPSKREKESRETTECVTFPDDERIRVVSGRKDKTWTFDQVFRTDCSQEIAYSQIAELVTSVLDGYNVCIFAYGQTGSGKTYTMTGPPDDRGCNLRALRDLFTKSEQRKSETKDTISVSVMEVYNENIRDLLLPPDENLASRKKLEVRRGDRGNYVPDLTTVEVHGDDQVLELMALSDKSRSQTSTNMNEASSRSHMLMSVSVESTHLSSGKTTIGRLHLVDLAGSERIDKSGATGQALKEAQNINKSLSALGDVIAARAQGASHIPFRNSTLTHLLQDSLSQDSKTLMFCCVSPVTFNADETFCTLNFASRVNAVELGRASKQQANSSGSGTSQQHGKDRRK